MKVDELLGTNTFQKHVSRNLSTDAMLPLVGQVCQNLAIGTLIIDEIQHLQNRGIQQMMNYFVPLMNSFGVPILFIGTPASYSIFQNEFRIARRVSGNGEIIWNNMENNNEFQFFLESIWKYQWNRIYTPLSEEMINVFYEQTQGVSDLIIKLFVNVQEMCIANGKEEFTVNMVQMVAKEQFKLMKPMIDAIKSKNIYKMAQFEDLRKMAISDVRNSDKGKISKSPVKIKKVEKKVEYNSKVINEPKEQRVKKVVDYEEGDLRGLLKKSDKEENTPYQLLLENGFIDDMSLWQGGTVK